MQKKIKDDAISRQAAIGAICTEGTRLERNGTVAMAEIKQWCVDILEALPSAQPELIEQSAYVRGFEQGRTQGMIDAKMEELCSSVQPERKKGRWIKVNGKTAINCSACYHCSWSLSFEDIVRKFNFCPNCSADMRGEQNERFDKQKISTQSIKTNHAEVRLLL